MRDKYSAEAIQKINLVLGAGHRVKPYDLTSAQDLKEALLVTVGAYRDYCEYTGRLIDLEENFDESLEYCDTAAWLDLARGSGQADELTVEGFAALLAAVDAFNKLSERAKENCAKIVKAVLSAPAATQKIVLGCEYKIEEPNMDARIAELFEALGEAEYYTSLPQNLEIFLDTAKEQWAAYMA